VKYEDSSIEDGLSWLQLQKEKLNTHIKLYRLIIL